MTWAELVQLVACGVGVCISLWLLVDAVKDRAHLIEEMKRGDLIKAGINGGLIVVASGNVRQESMRLTVQIILLLNAVLSVPLPSFDEWMAAQPDGVRLYIHPDWILIADIRRYLLALAAVILLMKSIFERLDRNAILVHNS